jgi:hypothetical protein
LAALRAAAQRLESGTRFTFVSHSASPNDETAPEAEHEKSQKSLRDEGISRLAGRQGFEPRYRGPEGAKEAPLISVSVGFARESASQLRAVSSRDGTFSGESFTFLSSHIRLIHKRAANVGTNGDSAFTDEVMRGTGT